MSALDNQTLSVIVVAFLGLIGTVATVGYKYKNTDKKNDPNQVIFDQVNNFIAEQRNERDDLRKELNSIKQEVRRLTSENERLRAQIDRERLRYNALERRFNALKDRADVRDVQDAAALSDPNP